MAFIRIKIIKGVKYYYLVQSIREDGKVKQKIVQYFGAKLPDGYVVPINETRPVVAKETTKKASVTKPVGKVKPSVVPMFVTTTPVPTTANRRAFPRKPGGNRHPIATKQFILDRLAAVGEDYISGLHQAYKAELGRLARERKRPFLYHHPTYFSFSKKVWELISARLVEFSGREEPSENPQFSGWKERPIKKYVRLARRG